MRTSEVILTNMCLVEDVKTGKILVQERSPERYTWSGYSFPGGHIEVGESLHAAVVREVFEETGLTITNPKLVGIKNWHTTDDVRYLVLCYKATEFYGTLKSSLEGSVSWVDKKEFAGLDLAYDMDLSYQLIENDLLSEFYYSEKRDGEWSKHFY